MRSTFIVLVLITAFIVTACGNKSGSPTSAVPGPNSSNARTTFADGHISFTPPANLKQLTKEQIAASKFSKGKPPDGVFANDSQSVTIGVVLNFIPLKPDELQDYIYANRRLLTMAIEDVQFLAEEIVTINGRQWVHFEVMSEAPDLDLHNHQYTTSFNGGALVFGFNSTVKEYPQYKDALLKSAQSIEIKE